MPGTNLPLQLTSFIGRERELGEVRQLVSSSRLVTLTGAGGCGKTRLAIKIANTVDSNFADGVWLADLVPLREPELVPQHIAQALGLHPAPNQHLDELLLDFVRPRQLLLILDNCEHLLIACAQLTQRLLSQAPNLRILATSRAAFSILGETVYPVQGLAWPSLSAGIARDPMGSLDPQVLVRYDAVHLFVERARAMSPYFKLTPENALAIIEICQRLDGIPLALELASARVNVLTAGQIAARLDDRFALLTSGQLTTVMTHHHTLRAAIDWSHDLLNADEQILLRRLAVFDAGFDLDTAEPVCSGEGLAAQGTLDLLASLVDKSLVMAETISRAEARYRLLETIREYALEKLEAAGEVNRLRDRHLHFFVARAEEIAPKLQGSPYQSLWRHWLHGELDNLRAALGWALESGNLVAGLRLAVALWGFWTSRGSMAEGRSWLDRFLAQAGEEIPILLRATATMNAGMMAGFLGEVAAAKAYERTAVVLCEAAGEAGLPVLALARAPKALAAMVDGDFATAYGIIEEGVRIFRRLDNDFELIMALGTQAMAAMGMGERRIARSLADEALSIARKVGDPYRTALVIGFFGLLEHREQNYGRAQEYFEEAVAGLRQLGKMREEPFNVQGLALTRLQQGDFKQAHALFCESLALYKDQGNPKGMAECLIGFGGMASELGMQAEAVRLLTAGLNLGGSVFLAVLRAGGMEVDRYLEAARGALTAEQFEEAQREGRAQTLEGAIEHALALPLVPAEAGPGPQAETGGLTGREREIAALIGRGRANGEIAAELVLSKRTVEKHVANILSKLQLTSRAQIVRWAMEHHLTNTSSQ